MSEPITEERLIEAITNITEETGYAPTLNELREVFDRSHIANTGAWRRLVARRRLGYDEHGRVVVYA